MRPDESVGTKRNGSEENLPVQPSATAKGRLTALSAIAGAAALASDPTATSIQTQPPATGSAK